MTYLGYCLDDFLFPFFQHHINVAVLLAIHQKSTMEQPCTTELTEAFLMLIVKPTVLFYHHTSE